MPTRSAPVLLPEPRSIQIDSGVQLLKSGRYIVIDSSRRAGDAFAIAIAIRDALKTVARVSWAIRAGEPVPGTTGLRIQIEGTFPVDELQTQSYVLDTTGDAISLQAISEAGAFHGIQTLKQLLRQYGAKLPRLRIEDSPDFARRGVMLDISRDKIPTQETLYQLVDMLAELKINELQLYTEHTFAFQKHPKVWKDASPMTPEDILALDAYCRARYIDLVPNQNCFGHMRRFLVLPEYNDLAEAPNGCDTRWGRFDKPFSLDPLDPRSLSLVGELLDDVLPNFSSAYTNINCDETVDLGQGKSEDMVAELGAGRVYLNFLQQIFEKVKGHNRIAQYWGDIIMEHPELVSELPKDAVALEWGYEFDHPFADHAAKFGAAGVPFYVCPGTSSWNSIGGRTDNMIGNIINAAENGLKNGARGLLNTDWGDNGHLQPLAVSLLGYAFGAAMAWSVAQNRDIDLARAVSLQLLEDASGEIGRVLYDMGNVYRLYPVRLHNATPYSAAAFAREGALRKELLGLDPAVTKSALTEVARLMRSVRALKPAGEAARHARNEMRYALELMRYGVLRLERMARGAKPGANEKALLKRVLTLHKQVWQTRNRPGGMKDSAANLLGKSDGM
jgi:hypothetical protein